MNRDKDKESPPPELIDDVPRSLHRAGLRKIETNLKEDQKVVLPKGLIVTFFKKEFLEALTKHAKETKAKQKKNNVEQSKATNLTEEQD